MTEKKLTAYAIISLLFAVTIYSVYLVFANMALEGDDFAARFSEHQDVVSTLTPKEHLRTPDQTFLTFPEWFLVHSPREYAELLDNRAPSSFPYFRHIGQFWQSYRHVYAITSKYFPFNLEYHVMIMVIGVSTTVEYALKGAYETMVGRIFEPLSITTPEDKWFAKGAADYVAFIDVDPWYKFPFFDYVRKLWSEVPMSATGILRSLERRYIMTTEYVVKAIYGKLIWKATAASFDVPIHETAVVVARDDHWRNETVQSLGYTWTDTPNPDYVLTMLPRYQAFTSAALSLAQAGVDFVEVAGNRGPILVSLLTPDVWKPRSTSFDVLFAQPMITKDHLKRVVIEVPVAGLAKVLRDTAQEGISVEHVYDF